MKSSSSLFVWMIIPAKHFLAVNTKNKQKSANNFIVVLLFETLETEWSCKRQSGIFSKRNSKRRILRYVLCFCMAMFRYNTYTEGFIWIFYSWNKILRLCVEIINYFYVFQPRSHFVISFYVLTPYARTSLQWCIDNINISGWIVL